MVATENFRGGMSSISISYKGLEVSYGDRSLKKNTIPFCPSRKCNQEAAEYDNILGSGLRKFYTFKAVPP